jgi:hypothetical protein
MRRYCFYVCALGVRISPTLVFLATVGVKGALSLLLQSVLCLVLVVSVVVLLMWVSRGVVSARQ